MPDFLVRGIDRDAGLRIIAAVTTDLSREAATRNGAVGIGACALGRALTSTVLLATLAKGNERVTLQIVSDGPLGGITVDARIDPHAEGEVRGYVAHPEAGTQPCLGRSRVVEVLGRGGVVNVMRDLGLRERYQGQTALLTGEVDEDVEGYLRRSEQVPSALGCDVIVDGARIVSAAGVLVQALPGAEPDAVRPSQHALRTGAVFDFLSRPGITDGADFAEALARAVYAGPIEFLGTQPLVYRCRCSAERVEEVLQLLSTVDLDEMIANDDPSQVTCNYCNTRYVISRETLERLRAAVAHGPRINN